MKDDVSRILRSKLRTSQRHRGRVEKLLEKLWEKERTITIVAMAKRPEIKDACEGKICRKHNPRLDKRSKS